MTDIEEVTIDLDFGESFSVPRIHSNSDEVSIEECSGVRFQLHRKLAQFGNVEINQWWLPSPGLYADRNRVSRNHQPVLDCFWGWCQDAGSSVDHRSVQESFILAMLLPEVRSNGARRVFCDAFVVSPEQESKEARYAALPTLDSMLRSSRQDTINSEEFVQQTASMLGHPEYDEEARECYEAISRGLFDDACVALEGGDAEGIRSAVLYWRETIKKISRRAGRHVEKQVLDVLSYEARAAFHRAYSATWLILIEAIKQRYGMSYQEEIFHRFWHLDQVMSDPVTPHVSSHLFHGHIFGLHPAFGDFMLTKTGSEIVGEFLSEPSENNYQRLIHGFVIAVYHYDQRRQDSTLDRNSKEKTNSDIELHLTSDW